jgi:antitoxin component YwqK of YwqJK toxin-antitoxin module
MKALLIVLSILAAVSSSNGQERVRKPEAFTKANFSGLDITNLKINPPAELKPKKGDLTRLLQSCEYEDGNNRYVIRQDFLTKYHHYLEYYAIPKNGAVEILLTQTHSDAKEVLTGDNVSITGYAYHGRSYIYNPIDGRITGTVYFEYGIPVSVELYLYFSNGQLQFIRQIAADDEGRLINVGILESYYPDGSRLENPLSEDGMAVIMLDDDGNVIDECRCIGDDILDWTVEYLYYFIGKFAQHFDHWYSAKNLKR